MQESAYMHQMRELVTLHVKNTNLSDSDVVVKRKEGKLYKYK